MAENPNRQRSSSNAYSRGQPDLGPRTSSSESPYPSGSRPQQTRPSLYSPFSSTYAQGSSETIERIPRFQRNDTEDTSSPAHERTRLLSEDRSEHQDPNSQSRDRASIHGSLRLPGIRYRASARDFRSPSMGQPHGPRRARGISVSIAPPPAGQDDDHGSQNFSLAGPQAADAMAANTSYVDPGYSQLNPEYEQPSNVRPVWGLAKPLPRVLRPGMVPTVSELHKEVLHQKQKQHRTDLERQEEDLEPDKIEATLRYDKIVPALKDVREEREIQLCETFGKISPFPSPSIRGNASMNAGFFSHDHSFAIPEETEELLGDQLSQLGPAIKDVRDSKVDDPPYEDAITLQAYEADENEIHNLHTYWSVIRLRFREPLAELLAVSCKPFFQGRFGF